MLPIVQKWVGSTVKIALRSTITVSITGTVRELDDAGVLLELPHGISYVPMTAILHISPMPAQ